MCYLNNAVVSANPDSLGVHRRDRHGEDCAHSFRAAQVILNWTTAGNLFGLVIAREIRTDGVPVCAAISGVEDHIAAQINLIRVAVGNCDWRGPVEAIL